MISPWQLPTRAVIHGKDYQLHADYRDILEIFSYLDDPQLPEFIRWQIALGLFYEEPVPPQDRQQAIEYLVTFLNGGSHTAGEHGPRLLDWQQDAPMIIADVNRVAGQEIRALPFLHWWTFLSWFHAIGEGRLSTLVAIRSKLHRGKKLEDWEQEFYRENKKQVQLPKRYTAAEQQQRQRLQQLLA